MRTLLFALCLIVLTGCKQSKEEEKQQETTPKVVTTYYLIRHAEKDRSDPENKDPELTAQGQRRASFWADHFKAVDLDAVYSSDYARTRQTAMPTAGLNGLEIEIYDPGNLYGEAFLAETKGKNILIVGHSNTIPTLVNQLIQEDRYPDIDDTDNASLFVVSLTDSGAEVERLSIDLP